MKMPLDEIPSQWTIKDVDCLEAIAALEPECIDLIVTSPPYNLGIDYHTYDDRETRRDYLQWMEKWAQRVQRVLSPRGSLFLNIGASAREPFLPHELILMLRPYFELQNTIHWIKSISIETKQGRPLSAGHYKPINSERYLNHCHEYIFHLSLDGRRPLDRLSLGVPYADKSNIKRWKKTGGHDKRCRGNTWFIPYETIQNRDKERPHPATFPVQLVKNCIRLHGQGTEITMLDPFLGIGSAAVAAREMNIRRFIGYEIDPHYLEIARERIANTQPHFN